MSTPSRRWFLPPRTTAGFALAFTLLLVAGGVGYREASPGAATAMLLGALLAGLTLLALNREAQRRMVSEVDRELLGRQQVAHEEAARAAAERVRVVEADRDALRVALDGAREQAESANRAKDEFLAVLSHELRNPLAPIQTALELMQDHDPSTESSALRIIENQLGHMVRLVDDLLVAHGGDGAARGDGTGRGSTFTRSLPAARPKVEVKVEAAPTPTPDSSASSEPPATTPAASLSVLVVDDNAESALLLEMYLRNLGHVVRIAHDGPSALDEVADFAPDVAFLDIGLPGMDGNELARRLRSTAGLERIQLVAVTGYGQEADRQRSEAAGFDLHLVKPVTRLAFKSVLEGFVATKTSARSDEPTA